MSQDRPVSQELAAKLAAYRPPVKIDQEVDLSPVIPITDPARLLPAPVEPEPETVE
jgi:hypothetical protein